MPANYAHRIFGDTVLHTLSPSLFERLEPHIPLFNMGLHGPDLLFYYQPWHSPALQVLGHRLHGCTCRQVISTMLEVIPTLPEEDRDGGLAYTLGFVCHFLLDSACHPYVGRLVEAGKGPHCTIEAEFDWWLMEHDGHAPRDVDPVAHIADLTEADYAVIAPLYAALSHLVFPDAPLKERPGDIGAAHRMMLRLSRIFASKNIAWRALARTALFVTGSYDQRSALVVAPASSPLFDGCSTQLFSLMEGAVWEAPAILEALARGDLIGNLDRTFL